MLGQSDSYTVVLQEKVNGTWMQEFVHDHVSSPQNPVVAPDTPYEMFVNSYQVTPHVFVQPTQAIQCTPPTQTVCQSFRDYASST